MLIALDRPKAGFFPWFSVSVLWTIFAFSGESHLTGTVQEGTTMKLHSHSCASPDQRIVRRSIMSGLCLASLLLASPAIAGQLIVPDQYMEVQEAIDAANPGDVIIIKGHNSNQIVIDKSLTLVGQFVPGGSSLPSISAYSAGLTLPPAITLAGPGSGTPPGISSPTA